MEEGAGVLATNSGGMETDRHDKKGAGRAVRKEAV